MLNISHLSDPCFKASSLLEAIFEQAKINPTSVAIIYNDEKISYQDLKHRILQYAAHFNALINTKEFNAIVKIGNKPEFIYSFYAIHLLGGTNIPIPDNLSGKLIASFISKSNAELVIMDESASTEWIKECNRCISIEKIKIACIQDINDGNQFPQVDIKFPESLKLAMLQFTSGTTGERKAVQLSHLNLLTNVRQMIITGPLYPKDIFVTWLPVYHDMGLIGMTMCPLYLGATIVLLPASPQPDKWLKAIQDYSGTVTAAPDFAYRFASKFCGKKQYDLQNLRIALIAAEPVRKTTIDLFESKFNVTGTLKPAYGLAEASVCVSFETRKNNELLIDNNGYVSVGKTIPELDLVILQNDQPVSPYCIGEIAIRGPNVTSGYYRDYEATQQLFSFENYLKTGDLGYLDSQNNLFVVDRIKNILLYGGRTLSPRELEEITDKLPSVNKSAAMGINVNGTEKILLFVEHRKYYEKDELDSIEKQIHQTIFNELSIKITHIFSLRKNSIPLTHNGKIQYSELRKMYQDNRVKEKLLFNESALVTEL